jgi:hypothetical protein
MGFSQAWVAVRGTAPDVVLGTLGLRRTGEREEVGEAALDGLVLPGNWYVVIANHELDAIQAIADDEVLRRVSTKHDLVCGFVEEHVMDSMLCAWSRGQRRWWILHNAEQAFDHLHVEGTPPDCFAAVRDRLLKQQNDEGGADAGVDHVFDIPVDIGVELTGYRYDMIPDGDLPYEVLARGESARGDRPPVRAKRRQVIRRAKPGFWGRLFGG